MIGRYYSDDFSIDINSGVSNYTQELLKHAMEFISRNDSTPFFLYWAPDSTHAPAYSSSSFSGTSFRDSYYGDAVRELDWAVGKILKKVKEGGR